MRALPFVLLATAVASGTWVSRYKDEVNPTVLGAGLEAQEQAAGASILGQFRSSAASSLFQKTDLYLHGGVELRAMTNQEKGAGKAGSEVKPGEKELLGDESHLVTSIPSAEEDFRGFLGDLERATAPYQDMHNHKHNSPEATFPLFRLMTWVDPQFLPGWTTGSMLMSSNDSEQSTDRAINFLTEGLQANPQSPEIMTRIGALVAGKKQDLKAGMVWFERALEASLKVKNPSPDQKDAREEAYRWVAIMANRLGDKKREQEIVEEALPQFPEDQVLLRFGIELGFVRMKSPNSGAESKP